MIDFTNLSLQMEDYDVSLDESAVSTSVSLGDGLDSYEHLETLLVDEWTENGEIISDMSQTWGIITTIPATASSAVALTRLVNARFLAAYYSVWQWLDRSCSEAIADIVYELDDNDSTSMGHWLRPLIVQLYNLFITAKRKVVLKFASIFPSATVQKDDIQLSISSPYVIGNERVTSITKLATNALAEWIGLQKHGEIDLWSLRGKVLNAILVETQQPGVLLLPEVYRAFQSPLPYVFAAKKTIDVEKLHSNLQSVIRTHPTLRRDLPLLTNIIDEHMQDVVQRLSWPASQTSSAESDEDALSRSQSLEPIASVPGPLLPQTHTNGVLHFMQFWNMLGRTEVTGQIGCPTSSWAHTDKDKLWPFREGAPSLKIMLVHEPEIGQPSPFHEDYSLSQAGLFSILLFRVCTFSTPILLQDHQKYFASKEDWTDLVQHYENNPDYLCRKDAYGRKNMHRNVGNGCHCWESATLLLDWCRRSLISDKSDTEEGLPAFIATCKFLRRNVKGAGELTSLLIATDLARSGVVAYPGEEEYARLILSLNKGATSALRSLGVIPKDNSKATDSNVRAFIDFFHQVKQNVATSEFAFAVNNFDLFDFEHTLCKISRALIRNSGFRLY